MKNDILNRIGAIINALNTVSVNGKQNLENLYGSISTLEDVARMLMGCEITQPENSTDTDEK